MVMRNFRIIKQKELIILPKKLVPVKFDNIKPRISVEDLLIATKFFNDGHLIEYSFDNETDYTEETNKNSEKVIGEVMNCSYFEEKDGKDDVIEFNKEGSHIIIPEEYI